MVLSFRCLGALTCRVLDTWASAHFHLVFTSQASHYPSQYDLEQARGPVELSQLPGTPAAPFPDMSFMDWHKDLDPAELVQLLGQPPSPQLSATFTAGLLCQASLSLPLSADLLRHLGVLQWELVFPMLRMGNIMTQGVSVGPHSGWFENQKIK